LHKDFIIIETRFISPTLTNLTNNPVTTFVDDKEEDLKSIVFNKKMKRETHYWLFCMMLVMKLPQIANAFWILNSFWLFFQCYFWQWEEWFGGGGGTWTCPEPNSHVACTLMYDPMQCPCPAAEASSSSSSLDGYCRYSNPCFATAAGFSKLQCAPYM
jgi:hypothetical protein